MFDPLRTTVDGEPVETWYRRLLTGDFLLWSPTILAEVWRRDLVKAAIAALN